MEFGRGSTASYVTDDKHQERQKYRVQEMTHYTSKLLKLFFTITYIE